VTFVCVLCPLRTQFSQSISATLHTTDAVFLLLRALEVSARQLGQSETTPSVVARFKHYDVVLNISASSLIVFLYTMAPHRLEKSYYNFSTYCNCSHVAPFRVAPERVRKSHFISFCNVTLQSAPPISTVYTCWAHCAT
jgi:hypothetical protein